MVDDKLNSIASISVLVTDDEQKYLPDVDKYVKHEMHNGLVAFILDEIETEVKPYRKIKYGTEYRLSLAILTPQRYRELLRKEEKYKWLTGQN